MVSGCLHLMGEKIWVARIGKKPYNIGVTEVRGNLSSRIQGHFIFFTINKKGVNT